VMSRVPGTSLAGAREVLATTEMTRVAAWLGRFLRRLHEIPLTPGERRAGRRSFRRHVGRLHARAVGATAEHDHLPRRLLEQVQGWMPPVAELLDGEEGLSLIHGDLRLRHVLGEVRGARFDPAGVIDFGHSRIAAPVFGLCHIWADLIGEEPAVREAFLAEARIPGSSAPGFKRRALAWALLRTGAHRVDWSRVPGIESARTLDELAASWHGLAEGEGSEPARMGRPSTAHSPTPPQVSAAAQPPAGAVPQARPPLRRSARPRAAIVLALAIALVVLVAAGAGGALGD
jgi:aminoglycoside phosphotransferase (APT) family kinase protein